jgi:hypothetical protein
MDRAHCLLEDILTDALNLLVEKGHTCITVGIDPIATFEFKLE